MPFDEEDQDDQELSTSKGLKKVSSKKSIFDDMSKKTSQKDLDNHVKRMRDRSLSYKQMAAEYSAQFKKIMSDRTLQQNKNIFVVEMESELLGNMIKLASEINADPDEQEGMGSLMWIVLLFKTCLTQRDKINKLEYFVSQLEKKTDPIILESLVKKEIVNALDKTKNSG